MQLFGTCTFVFELKKLLSRGGSPKFTKGFVGEIASIFFAAENCPLLVKQSFKD